MTLHPLAGIYAAAVTPMNHDQSIALDDIPVYLAYLAERGCHGALLLGTTGEGPSFAVDERLVIFKSALKVREEYPEFRLLAGTGTPSLEETIFLTKSAFDMGFTGAVVLPPYYFHQASDDGLFYWFQDLLNRSVPSDGYLLGYHFPAQSGVPIPLNVLSRLRQAFPKQFVGIKDSTANAELTHQIGASLDEDLVALVGNDKLLTAGLDAGGSGCITAMANIYSPISRKVWDSHKKGDSVGNLQEFLSNKRSILDNYKPFPFTIKALLNGLMGFPLWSVRHPLTPLSKSKIDQLLQEMSQD